MMALTRNQQERYARHIALKEIGEKGQQRLLASRVLVIGAGGLGSPAAFYLAAAGIGTIGIMDGDHVDLSNLQRQILHTTASVGRAKTDSASERLHALDPSITLECFPFHLTPGNAAAILSGFDVVLDATDNFDAKFLISRACHEAEKPSVHAGIKEFSGQVMTIIPGTTTCCHCLFHTEGVPDGGTPRGPIGALPGIIGSIQATEAIKYLLGIGRLLTDRLLTCDLLTMKFRSVPLSRNSRCPLCGNHA